MYDQWVDVSSLGKNDNDVATSEDTNSEETSKETCDKASSNSYAQYVAKVEAKPEPVFIGEDDLPETEDTETVTDNVVEVNGEVFIIDETTAPEVEPIVASTPVVRAEPTAQAEPTARAEPTAQVEPKETRMVRMLNWLAKMRVAIYRLLVGPAGGQEEFESLCVNYNYYRRWVLRQPVTWAVIGAVVTTLLLVTQPDHVAFRIAASTMVVLFSTLAQYRPMLWLGAVGWRYNQKLRRFLGEDV